MNKPNKFFSSLWEMMEMEIDFPQLCGSHSFVGASGLTPVLS